MAKQSIEQLEKVLLKKLSQNVGDFIRYWGFRRIHGQIWTHIFLSKTALSAGELVRALGVSKALMSPALVELVDYGLIQCVNGDERTKRYRAKTQVYEIIRKVLARREATLIGVSKTNCTELGNVHQAIGQDTSLDTARFQALQEMIDFAEFAIEFLLVQDGFPELTPTEKSIFH